MKKNYEKPTVEVVKFQYRDQVVATSGGSIGQCYEVVVNLGSGTCTSGDPIHTGRYQNDLSHI